MQNVEPDYAPNPEVPKTVPVEDSTDTKIKEFRTALDAEKKKRRSRPWLVLALSLLLLGVGAASAIVIYKTYFENPAAPVVDIKSTEQTNTPVVVDAARALAAAKKVFPGSSTTIEKPLFALQVPGYSFLTDLNSQERYVGVSGEIAASENTVKLAEIGRELKAQGLAEDLDQVNFESAYTARYKGADAVCIVTSLGSQTNKNAAHAAQVACANMSEFKKVAAAQKPFVDAEAAASAIEYANETAWYGLPVIKDSPTAGYKTATLMTGPANVAAGVSELLFYQAPNATWKYATRLGGVGPQPECTSFSNDDAKKAYAGMICYNSGTASTVKP